MEPKLRSFRDSSSIETLGICSQTESSLSVLDKRTGRIYSIPIKKNAIRATDLQDIRINDGKSGAGLTVLDPGYLNTAVVETSISSIDGDRGIIQYRNKSLDRLIENNDWEEVVYLLIWGDLPSLPQKMRFRRKLAEAMKAPQSVVDVIHAFPLDAHVSSMVIAGLAAFVSCDEGSMMVHGSQPGQPYYLGNEEAIDAGIIRALSSLAVIFSLVYCRKHTKRFTPADAHASLIGNLLLMMGFTKNGKPDTKIEKCLEKLWILNADHGMTNSTSAFLHASSTLTDPMSAMISAIVSAYGPLHAGAIDIAYKSLELMSKTPTGVQEYIKDVKSGKKRLFGYGHRIYKTIDPRSKWIRAMIEEHKELVCNNGLLRIAMEVDKIASQDEYFTSRNLKVNADLFGCFLYTAMGFENDIIIAMASMSRMGGVLAHWRESMLKKPCLWRPQQIHTEMPITTGEQRQEDREQKKRWPMAHL